MKWQLVDVNIKYNCNHLIKKLPSFGWESAASALDSLHIHMRVLKTYTIPIFIALYIGQATLHSNKILLCYVKSYSSVCSYDVFGSLVISVFSSRFFCVDPTTILFEFDMAWQIE